MASKAELEKKLEYARGYRDALVDTWEEVIKLATKGYSSRELQIMAKTQARDSREKVERQIQDLEADASQNDIIDADDDIEIIGVKEVKPLVTLNMQPGMSYLVKEPKPARCYSLFEREMLDDRIGLCVARQSPRELRDSYNLAKSQIIWLTTNEKLDGTLPPSALGVASRDEEDYSGSNDEYVQPTALHVLYSYVLNFLEGNNGGVIVFEGVEYLASHNKFVSVLNMMQKINENVKRTGSNLIMSVNPSAFEPKNLSLLESEVSKVL